MQDRHKASKPEEPWAARIAAAIQGSKKSLRQFATVSGIPYQSLRAYAAGEKKPGLDALTAIVIGADVSPVWLLTGEGEMYQHRALTKSLLVDGRPLTRAATELELAWIRVKEQRRDGVTAELEALPLGDLQYRKLVAKELGTTLGEVESRIEHVAYMTGLAATIYNLFADVENEEERNRKIREQAYYLLTFNRGSQRASGTKKSDEEMANAGDHKPKSEKRRKPGPKTRSR